MRGSLAEAVAAAWALQEPVSVVPATSGTQGQTWRVESGSGTFFLRLYSNTDDPRRVRYEHDILAALSRRPLSFRVAAPLQAASGGTAVWVGHALAALFPKLDGERVDRSIPSQARACGGALAELHAALRAIGVGPAPDTARYGDLERIHARVPDPWSLPSELNVDELMRERMMAILERLRARVPELYATLPQQLCHNDCGPGNLLIRGDAISAVLDFEFVAPDLRAMDVCVGWYWTALRERTDGWQMDVPALRAFLEGYAVTSSAPLTPAEIDAMPDLALLLGAVSAIHREGRHRAGLDSEQSVLDKVRQLLALDDWLRATPLF